MSMPKVALLLIVGGLVWMFAEWHEDRANANRHHVPTETELASTSGKAVAARVVDIKRDHNVLENHYVELDIQGEEGTRTVRIGVPHSDSTADGIGGRDVTAKYDPTDDNKVYSLSTADREIIAYQKSADYKKRLVESNSGSYTIGIIAFAFGIALLWFGRMPAT